MSGDLLLAVYVFMLSVVVGFEVIARVPSTLHTPLMSGANAIHGVIIIGAIVTAGALGGPLGAVFGFVAVALATANVVGGFAVTDRMLAMFDRRREAR